MEIFYVGTGCLLEEVGNNYHLISRIFWGIGFVGFQEESQSY